MLLLSKFASRCRIAACVFAAAAFVAGFPALTQRAEEVETVGGSLPALSGPKAIEYLKQNRQYDSLMEAFAANRTGQPDEMPTEDAFEQTAKLTAADGGGQDFFGISVAISGDTAIVGAFLDDVGANANQGSAYIFVRSGTTWSQQQKLTAADGAAEDVFGVSVAISGETAIVGANEDDVGANGNQGSAYVFVRSGTTWSQQQKLTAADGAAEDVFGVCVAISGETAIVGANEDDVGANGNQGSAYIFVRSGTTWSQQQKLTASDGVVEDFFGVSVAISGDTAIVGAFLDDVGVNASQGSAYVFTQPFGFESDVAPRNTGDGVVITTDVVQMRRFAAGLDTPDPTSNEFQRSDSSPRATFGDGIIDSTDVVQARRYATGLDPLTPAGGPAVAADHSAPALDTRSRIRTYLDCVAGAHTRASLISATAHRNLFFKPRCGFFGDGRKEVGRRRQF